MTNNKKSVSNLLKKKKSLKEMYKYIIYIIEQYFIQGLNNVFTSTVLI